MDVAELFKKVWDREGEREKENGNNILELYIG